MPVIFLHIYTHLKLKINGDCIVKQMFYFAEHCTNYGQTIVIIFYRVISNLLVHFIVLKGTLF